MLQNGSEMLVVSRVFLSNSRNLWSLSAVFELLYILYAVVPLESVQVSQSESFPVTLYYPPPEVLQSAQFWTILFHWFLPTLFVPILFGTLISFHPTKMIRPGGPQSPAAPLDPLTASIIRLAAQVAYPYSSIKFDYSLDVVGFKWRVLNASVGVAFAFAEAIALAPEALAKQLSKATAKPSNALTINPTLSEELE